MPEVEWARARFDDEEYSSHRISLNAESPAANGSRVVLKSYRFTGHETFPDRVVGEVQKCAESRAPILS